MSLRQASSDYANYFQAHVRDLDVAFVGLAAQSVRLLVS